MEMHSTESWVFHDCPKGQRDDGEPCMAADEVMYRLLSITWHIGSDCLQSIWQQMLRGFHTSSNVSLNPCKAFYIYPGRAPITYIVLSNHTTSSTMIFLLLRNLTRILASYNLTVDTAGEFRGEKTEGVPQP